MAQAKRGRDKIPDENLYSALWDVSDMVGRRPTCSDIQLYCEYSYNTYINRFGSLKESLWAAGFDVTDLENKDNRKIPIEHLKIEMKRLAEDLGRTPTVKDMNTHGEYSVKPYVDEFGSWTQAQIECGLEPTLVKGGYNISRDRVVEEVYNLNENLEKFPTLTQINEHCSFSQNMVYKHFSSISQLEKYVSDYEHDSEKVFTESNITTLQNLLVVLGRPPTKKEACESLKIDEDDLEENYPPISILYERAGIIFVE